MTKRTLDEFMAQQSIAEEWQYCTSGKSRTVHRYIYIADGIHYTMCGRGNYRWDGERYIAQKPLGVTIGPMTCAACLGILREQWLRE